MLYDCVVISDEIKITSFDMTEPSPCVLLFPMYFLVSSEKAEANLQILQWNPYFDY